MKILVKLLATALIVGAAAMTFTWLSRPPAPLALEDYIPGDALVYVRYMGLDAADAAFEGTAVRDILNEEQVVAFRNEFSRLMTETLSQARGDTPFTWEDIRALFDCQMAFAAMESSSGEITPVFVLDPGRHARRIKRFVNDIIKETSKFGPPPVEASVAGVDYTKIGGSAIAWVKGALVVTDSVDTLEKIVKTRENPAGSMSSDARLRAMRAKTSAGPEFLMAHVRADEIVKIAAGPSPDPDRVREGLADTGFDMLRCVHFSIVPDAPGMRTFCYLYLPDGAKGVWTMLPGDALDEARMLAEVPGDVTTAVMVKWSPAKAYDALLELTRALGVEEEFAEAIAEANRTLGLDLRAELLGALGDEIVLESAPKGGPDDVTARVSMKVVDEAKAQACIEKLAKLAGDAMGDASGPGPAASIRKTDHNGTPVFTITMPALPLMMTPMSVPMNLEPSFAVGRGRLIAATSLPLVIEALDATGAPKHSLAADADFAAQRARLPKDVSLMSYVRVQENVTQGWAAAQMQLSQMLMTAPGMPPNRLAETFPDAGAIAPHLFGSVATMRFDGEGFMLESYGPFGGLSNPASAGVVAVVGVAAGFTAPMMFSTRAVGGPTSVHAPSPAYSRRRESTYRAVCMNNLRQIGLAMKQYAADHDNKYPTSFAPLLKESYITTTKVFFCPSSAREILDDFPTDFKEADLADLTAIDVASDYVIYAGVTPDSPVDFILVHEKPYVHDGDGQNVLFNDGHVKWHDDSDFFVLFTDQAEKMKETTR